MILQYFLILDGRAIEVMFMITTISSHTKGYA